MSHSGWSTSNYTAPSVVPTGIPLTIHARVNLSATGLGYVGCATTGSGASYCALRISSGTKIESINVAGGTTATGATTLSTGTWYSVVGRWDGTLKCQVFLDGAQDGTAAGTPTASGWNKHRVGIVDIGSPSSPLKGSGAEYAAWNAALSAEDIAALVYMSPLKIRPDALIAYLPLLDSGTLDLMAPAATVTGTLTKDNDHPRVIYPRQRQLVHRSAGLSTLHGTASQTLAAITESAASKLRLKGASAKALAAFTGSAASKLRIKGTA